MYRNENPRPHAVELATLFHILLRVMQVDELMTIYWSRRSNIVEPNDIQIEALRRPGARSGGDRQLATV